MKTRAEKFPHDNCPECGAESVPAEKVPDQVLRGCPKCLHTWVEDFDRPANVRAEKIKAGRIWVVYYDAKPDKMLFEGSRTACRKHCRDHDYEQWRKKGIIRIGQLICETKS